MDDDDDEEAENSEIDHAIKTTAYPVSYHLAPAAPNEQASETTEDDESCPPDYFGPGANEPAEDEAVEERRLLAGLEADDRPPLDDLNVNGSVMTDSKIDRLVSDVDSETRDLERRRRRGSRDSVSSSSEGEEFEGGERMDQRLSDDLFLQLREAENTNIRLREDLDVARRRVDELETRQATTQQQLDKSERRLASQESQLRLLRKRLESGEGSDSDPGASSSASRLRDLRRQLEESQRAELALRGERDELRARLQAVDQRYAGLVAELRARVGALEAELSAHRSTEAPAGEPAPEDTSPRPATTVTRRMAPPIPSEARLSGGGGAGGRSSLLSAGSLENIAAVPTTDAVISIEDAALPGEGAYKSSSKYGVAKAEIESQAQPSSWGVEDVVRFIKANDLSHLEQVVRMMAIDGSTLLRLDGQAMKDKGIQNATDRSILKRRIKELNKSEEAKSPSAAVAKTKKSRFPFVKG